MRAVLVGTVESSRTVLESIVEAPGWTLTLAVTLSLEKRGRHSDFVDLAEPAKAAGCRLLRTDNINSEVAIAAIREASADYVFVVGWSQICGPEFLAACADRIIGYHPAPLPRLRGRAVIPWTILNQEPISAGTLFWIDEGVDTGPILQQEFFHVAPGETAASLYQKHMGALKRITARALEELKTPVPPRIVQDARLATWAARRTASDGLINWSKPALEIDRLVRALSGPYPAAFTFEGEHRVDIIAARVEHGEQFVASPGQVVSRSQDTFEVKCGDGMTLLITAWSHPQKRAPKLHSNLAMNSTQMAVPQIEVARHRACQCGRETSHV